MKRLVVALALILTLGAAVPVVAQVPAVQQAVAAYLTSLPADFNTMAPDVLKARLDAGEKIFVLDVRETNEFADGHIQGATNVPVRTIVANADKLPAAKDTLIIVVCRTGIRAAYGTMALYLLGYTNVKDMSGGMAAWGTAGFPTIK